MSCGNLEVPQHAYVVDEIINSLEKPYSYQDVIVHSCMETYKLIDNDPIRVCNQSGMWSGQNIKCQSKK